VLAILLSAALYTLAMPPWDLTPLAWIALVPLLYALRDLSPRRAALAGLLWGVAMIWGIGHWVPVALSTYWGQSPWFGLGFAMTGAVIFVGTYGAGFAASATWFARRCRGVSCAVLLAALWVSWEVARGRFLSGDPWLLLGYALAPWPRWIQIADLGGVYLVSFVVAFVNAAIAESLDLWRCAPLLRSGDGPGARSRWRHAVRLLAPAVLMAIAVYGYGLWRLQLPLPESPAVPTMVVQGNNRDAAQWRPGFYGHGLEDYIHLSEQAAARLHPQVIIWPEAAVTMFLAHEPRFQAPIRQLLRDTGAELIVGAPHYDDTDPAIPRFLNSAFHVTADGIDGRYDKVHLLPFAEYFPLRTIAFLRRSFERVRIFTQGGEAALLDTRFGPTAVVICFEAIFPDLVRERMARGGRVLVVLSNDVWLGDYAGPWQHLGMVRLRAVENRTWVLRATTTGVSAIIDPFGRIRAHSELFAPDVLHAAVVPQQIETLYKRLGDWFAWVCVVLSIAAALLVGRSADRR